MLLNVVTPNGVLLLNVITPNGAITILFYVRDRDPHIYGPHNNNRIHNVNSTP